MSNTTTIDLTSPTVLISYAHDNDEHKQHALDLADRLNNEGVDCWIDRYVEGSDPEHGWPAWMEEKVRTSDYVLVVASERYLARFEHREVDGKGQGARFESLLLLQEIFERDSKNQKFIPVIFRKEDQQYILGPLRAWTRFNIHEKAEYERLYARLTGQIKIQKPPVGKVRVLAEASAAAANEEPVTAITIIEIPELPQFTTDMKPGAKILNAFFSLPKTRRFAIAGEMHLLQEGETADRSDADKLSGDFLIRAKEQGLLAILWTKLFDENIDPNPFKTK